MNHYDNIIRMANQIAAYYKPYGHDDALNGVTNHLQKFWEKRMRLQLHDYIDSGGSGLDPLVLEAEKRLERPIAPVVHSATEVEEGVED